MIFDMAQMFNLINERGLRAHLKIYIGFLSTCVIIKDPKKSSCMVISESAHNFNSYASFSTQNVCINVVDFFDCSQ